MTIGDVVNFRVRAISNATCGARIAYVTQATRSCVATIGNGFNRKLEIDSILCYGEPSPRINFAFANGVAPITYIIDSLSQSSNPIFIDKIRAGNHKAIVIDSTGCSDTLSFFLSHPPILKLLATATDLKCSGDETGKITLTSEGGVGNYTYRLSGFTLGEWRNQPSFDSLRAGAYTVEMQDGNGCSVENHTEIVSPVELFVDLTNQNVRCFGKNDGYVNAATTGGVKPYKWEWSNGAATEKVDSLQAGSYEVTVSDKNGCRLVYSIDIEENTKINIGTQIDSAKCFEEESGRVRISAEGGISPYVFQWNNGVIGDDNPNIVAGNYKVTVTDAVGCEDTLTTIVYQPDSIRFDSLVTVNTKCSSDANGSITAYTSGGIAPYEYLWTPTNRKTQTINDLPAGRYVVTVKDANGCLFDSEATVKANAPINVNNFTIVKPLKCFGDSDGSISVKASGGVGAFIYNWSTTPNQNTDTIQGLIAGKYTVTITDANNCFVVKDTVLSEPTAIKASIASFTNVKCKGESNGTATPSVSGGIPFTNGLKYIYLWSDTASQKTPVASTLKAGMYNLSVTDANGCMTTTNVTIKEPPTAVTAVANQTKLGCYNQNTGEATVDASGGTGNNYTYVWNNLQRTRTVVNLGRQAYSVTVTDINGCQAGDTIEINTHDSISISISAIAPRCFGLKNGTITVDSIKGGASNGNLNNITYRWNTSPIQSTVQAVNITGNKTYTVTVVDNQGCQNKANFFVSEPLPILIKAIKKDVSCFGGKNGEAEIQPTGEKTPFKYVWAQSASAQTTARAINLPAGQYGVTITDTSQCSVDTVINVNQPPVLKIQSQQITNTKCVSDATGKINVSIAGGTAGYIYSWSNGASTPSIENLKSGSYDLIVTDTKGCQLQQTFSVTTPNALDGEVSKIDIKCFGESNGKINIDAFGGTQPYSYSIDGKNYNGVNQIVGVRAGKYDIFIKDANNCIWFDGVDITQPPRFSLEAIPDVTINLGDSIQLYANAINNRGNISTVWRAPYDSTLSCAKCPTPMAKPSFSITYAINATDSAGCRATDSVKITVVKPRFIFVPSGFTPNNDQVNDWLTVRGKDGTKILVFRIYDRWGELLYEAKDFKINDENNAWDGKFRGQYMNSGLYVWYIEAQYIDGAKETLKGNTTLIR